MATRNSSAAAVKIREFCLDGLLIKSQRIKGMERGHHFGRYSQTGLCRRAKGTVSMSNQALQTV
jgi:hypothetical protein